MGCGSPVTPSGATVWRLDPRTEKLVGTVHLSFVPKGIAAGAGGVWVTSLLGDTVSRIDPASNRITATIPVGRGSDGVAARGGAVWVANVIDGTVSRVDAAGRTVTSTIDVGGPPSASRTGPTGCGRSCADEPPAPHLARSRGRGHPGARRRGALGRVGHGRPTAGYPDRDPCRLQGQLVVLLRPRDRRCRARADRARSDPSGRTPPAGVDGATVGGRPVSLVYGCMDGTATSALVEARRLVEREHADIVIGPIAANEESALQGYARLRPDTVFVNGIASAHVQHQAPNFFSFHGDGAQWMAGLGTYAYRPWAGAPPSRSPQEPDCSAGTRRPAFSPSSARSGGKIRSRISVARRPRTSPRRGEGAETPSRRPLDRDTGLSPAAVIAVALARSYPGLRGTSPRRIILGVGDSEQLRSLGPRIRGLVSAIFSG